MDTRTDIYSLGVLLYELLTGKPPFDPQQLLASGLDEMRRTIREQDPPKPSTCLTTLSDADLTTIAGRRGAEPHKLPGQVSGDLDWVVMKALEKDRARRYDTANGFALDIERYLNNEPVAACPPSNLYRFRKLVRRNKFLFVAASAVAISLIVGLGVSTWLFLREKEARQAADIEAIKSQQVAQFLKDMLQGVGPSVALGRDTTMLREILDKTAERVGQDLTNQPAVEAELRNTIGWVYLGLGQYPKAEAMQREALSITRKAQGDEHLDVVEVMVDLAAVLRAEGKYAEAEALLREALSISGRLPGNENRDRSDVLAVLADVLRYENKLDEAEPMSRQALSMRRKEFGNEDLRVGFSLNDLALVLQGQHKSAEAETMFREALAIYKKVFGDENPETAVTLDNLARMLYEQERFAEAETMYRETLAMRRKLFGNEHPRVADSLNNLTLVLLDQERFTEAETICREALAMRRKLLGDDHPLVADSLYTLARVLCEEGKLPEAEALIREDLAIGERTGDSKTSAWALQLLAKILVPEGKSAEAEAAIHKAVAIEKQFNDNNLRAWNHRTLGLVLAHEGKLAEAETVYREDLQFVKSTLDKTQAFSAVLTDLGDTLYQQGRFAEAETAYREALAARRSGSGNEMRTAESLNNLATALHAEGQLDEAEALAREGLAICEKKVPDNWNWRTFDARRLLGGILVGQKKYAEAEPLLRFGYEGIKQQLDRIPLYCNPHLKGGLQRPALEELVQLCEATGRPDQAAEWKKALEETAAPIPVTTPTSDTR